MVVGWWEGKVVGWGQKVREGGKSSWDDWKIVHG